MRSPCEGQDAHPTAIADCTARRKENKDAAWYYPDPKPAAAEIAGRIAFWKAWRPARRQATRVLICCDRGARPS
ncbi:DUF427 domain-containing protein [Sphingosinicella sp. LHD-64]|uniref:DUF427 domain-containing protein n=1 Tax=Sphingosinicella sp. LHD-64 TaxID=3072139 RepID=UPI00280F98B1|nr:DUF427 domain-containing protein [Sphingosinicella sp. LHD-64]MDQ8755405.1 DUF427 domain-containing protein [Sphingosinicella sp. LHD-64]